MKIVAVAEMIQIERASDAAGHSFDAMMELAGRAVAAAVSRQMHPWETTGSALILVGPGNNGGDGLVAARYLHDRDPSRPVRVYCWKRTPAGDGNYAAVSQRGIPIYHAEEDAGFGQLTSWAGEADVIVDALLGTGVARPIGGALAELLATVRRCLTAGGAAMHSPAEPAPDAQAATQALVGTADYRFLNAPVVAARRRPCVVAVDCPSGLNCDSGALDPAALPADLTVTFAYPKRGHFALDGPAASGQLVVADIGVDPALAADVRVELAMPAQMRRLLPARPADAHKGTFGKALAAAGSVSYSGAAHLACAAAYRSGAGLVTGAVIPSIHPILATGLPEATWLLLPESRGALAGAAAAELAGKLAGYAALLVGPGISQQGEAGQFVRDLLGSARDALAQLPLVLDADALNALASTDDWPGLLPANAVLTPHLGEMARLCRITVAEVRADRVGLARRKAVQWNAVVVLKGAHTVIASPDDYATVLPFANPALATAGSGDVLAGVITGLLSQGLAPYAAAVLGGYLHGLAGELARQDLGDAGVVAGDLVIRLPLAMRQLRAA